VTALVLVLVLAAPIVSALSQAALVPPHADAGIDINANTLFEVLRMYIEVDVTIAGDFFVFADLYDNSGFFYITSGSAFVNLPLGPTTVIADIPGQDIFNSGFDGPYVVNLQVYDDVFNLDDSGVHMTGVYLFTDFEPPEAVFAPPHSDTTVDTDADLLYDFLRVNAMVDVTTAASFTVDANAFDMFFGYIASASSTVFLPAGVGQTIAVDLLGWAFRANGVGGPYTVELYLSGPSGFLGFDTHVTAAYLAADFEMPPGSLAPPHADRGIDTDGDSLFNAIEANISVSISVAGDYIVEANFYDSTLTTFFGGNTTLATLPTGFQVVPVWKSTIEMVLAGYDGQYNVQILLRDAATFTVMDTDAFLTASYMFSQFDPVPVTFAPPHADAGEDRDLPPDGQFNVLRVDVSVNADTAGSYLLVAELWDSTMTTFVASTYFQFIPLVVGTQTVPVYFSGIEIRQSAIDGPYLVNLFVGDFFYLYDTDVHMTGAYLATDFQAVTPGNLDGTIRDAVTSFGIPFASVTAYDYTNLVVMGTNADGMGLYSLPLYQGNWIVVYDDFAYDDELSAITVAASTTVNAFLDPSPPGLFFGNLTLSTWSTFDLLVTSILQNDVQGLRQFIDWQFGDRSQFLSQAEFDAFLAAFGFVPPTPPNSTWDFLLTDSIFYELSAGSESFAFQNVPGTIDSTVPLRLVQSATYQNGTIAAGGAHTVDVNVTYDNAFQDGQNTLLLPPGYVLNSFTGAPGVSITGVGTQTAVINPGLDPTPFDGIDFVWVQLVSSVPDFTDPVIASVGAAPNPVLLGNSITISASASDNVGIATAWLQAWDPSGGLVVDAAMADLGGGNYDYSFPPGVVGAWTYTVTVTDFGGNAVSNSGAFSVIELTPPTVSGASVTPDPQEYGLSVLFAATVTDNIGIATVTVAVRDSGGALVGNFTMAYNAGSGMYEYTGTVLRLGMNTFTVWATDTSGNRGSSSGTFEIVDTTAPVLTGETAVPNPVEAGTPVQIRANATDLAGIASVRVEIRDPSNAVVGNFSMTLVSGTYQYSYTPTALGNYAFTITAADASGNTDVATGTFASQDTMNPVADAGADANARVGLVVSLDGSGSTDNHGIVNYTWTFMEGPQTTTMTGVAPTHTFTAAGTYVITLRVTDESGNYAEDTVTITVQVVAPAGGLAGWVVSLILAIIVAVIVAALLLFFMRRKKAAAAPPPSTEGTAPPPEPPESLPPPPQE